MKGSDLLLGGYLLRSNIVCQSIAVSPRGALGIESSWTRASRGEKRNVYAVGRKSLVSSPLGEGLSFCFSNSGVDANAVM